MIIKQLKDFIRRGGYAWPGGYPMALLMHDGEAIDALSAKENYRQILQATRNPGTNRQWQAVEVFIHWEGPALICAHSGRAITSAYGEGNQ